MSKRKIQLTKIINKSGLALDVFLRKSSKASYLLLRTAARLSPFSLKRSRDLPSKAVLRCMGGDISAVVPSASRRPRTFGVLSVGR